MKLSDAALAKQILIVDDSHINQRILCKWLEKVKHQFIDVAANGREAVDMVKARPSAYGLILMDSLMPVMGGQEATRLIRDMGLDVPIIAMIGHSEKNRELFLTPWFDDYLSKPVRGRPLHELMMKWLDW
ncbi:hypothetical protein V493_03298 [Pseudogymnoascus sp. VKM F-4281 (FW-2241)]|nr:hypothetical protein V493_03298 [Pseudogymnoascus sp. VKM F-4281 (FW-2241)]